MRLDRHQPDLSGGFFDNGTGRAPALAGPKAFDSSLVNRWRDPSRSANSLRPSLRRCRSRSRRACPSRPTSISRRFVMSKNGIPAGAADLPADVEAMQQIAIVPEALETAQPR